MGPFNVCWEPPPSYLTSSTWVLAEPGPTSSAYLEPEASYLWCQSPHNFPQGPHLDSHLDLGPLLCQPEALLLFPKPWSLSEPDAQVKKQLLWSFGPVAPQGSSRGQFMWDPRSCEVQGPSLLSLHPTLTPSSTRDFPSAAYDHPTPGSPRADSRFWLLWGPHSYGHLPRGLPRLKAEQVSVEPPLFQSLDPLSPLSGASL